jgi:hypothetical protein
MKKMEMSSLSLGLLLGAATAGAQIQAPPGFEAEVLVGDAGLFGLTDAVLDPDGRVLVSEADFFNNRGRVLIVADEDGPIDPPLVLLDGFELITGMALRPRGSLRKTPAVELLRRWPSSATSSTARRARSGCACSASTSPRRLSAPPW